MDHLKLRNVTTMCNITGMDKVTVECAECGDEMHGRADRKFCSSACRQKAHRSKRNVTRSRDVTAEPFLLSEGEPPYKYRDDFWAAIGQLPEMLTTLSMYREGTDLEFHDIAEPLVVPVTPPRRKAKDLAEQDELVYQKNMQEFLDGYDEMVQNLASMKATAELILKHNGWEQS